MEWRGTGCPVSERCATIDVGATLSALACAMHLASPGQLEAMRVWLGGIDSRDGTNRVQVKRLRAKALRACMPLPAWWRCRLALRQAVRYGMTVDPILRPLLEATRAWLDEHYPTPIPGGSSNPSARDP